MDTALPWSRRTVPGLRRAVVLSGLLLMNIPAAGSLLLDDRASNTAVSRLGTTWRLITDNVMGGVSRGDMQTTTVAGRSCLRLTGDVSLENNGGFVQASLDLNDGGTLDASDYTGIELDVYGNGERYNLHLRTPDNRIVWQSYRAGFAAGPEWQTIRLPLSQFEPYRTSSPLDASRLRRLALVAIGREMQADLCVARIALYRS